jgi:hypothetical protein
VQDVDFAAGQLGQHDVAVDHDVFGNRRHAAQAQPYAHLTFIHDPALSQFKNLSMDEYRLVEHLAVFQCPPHDLGAGDRRPIVSERHRPAGHQPADLRQFLPGSILGHCADRENVAIAGPLGLEDDELRLRLSVKRRLGIRHTRNRRNPAGHRGGGSRFDCFILLAARLAQVNMHVY